jgi:hexosaminidase
MYSAAVSVNIQLQIVETGDLEVALVIQNNLPQDLKNWQLHFDLPKSVAPGPDTRMISQTGSHICLSAASDNPVLASGEYSTLRITGPRAIIQRSSDLPNGLYLQTADEVIPVDGVEDNLSQLSPAYLPFAGGNSCGGSTSHTPDSPRASGQAASPELNATDRLIPRPARMQATGGYFSCSSELPVQMHPAAEQAFDWLETMLPTLLQPCQASADTSGLQFVLDSRLAPEAYRLSITTEAILLEASDSAGFFYASVSLTQLAQLDGPGAVRLPCCIIEDHPRFEYRGVMLDCARNFHSKNNIIKLLDLMAEYKFNRFHWHLTDDEGWRIEIKAFPQLTDIGAWRGAGEALDSQFGSGALRYGGFYSQEDIRAIVEHARRRNIMVIPEIDIPGHSRAAIKSLPQLLVEPEDQSDYCSVQLYNDNVLNPALPATYDFLYTVLDEVCELFPGPYVHIGADEVPEGVWQNSPACRALMTQFGYQSYAELQGHLLRKLQHHLAKRGRKLVGWEEAAEGDKLDHSAIICAWSSLASASNTAANGYEVIACPAPFTYLDLAWSADISEPGLYWAGTSTLENCYRYEPEADVPGSQGHKQFLGIQACLWGELLRSQERLEYMFFPRALAIAEIAWSQSEPRDWDNFQQRVKHRLHSLAQRGVNHRPISIEH